MAELAGDDVDKGAPCGDWDYLDNRLSPNHNYSILGTELSQGLPRMLSGLEVSIVVNWLENRCLTSLLERIQQ